MSITSNPFNKFQSLKKISLEDKNILIEFYENLLLMDMLTKEDVLKFQSQRDLIEKHSVNEMAESYFLMTTDLANEQYKKRKEYYDQVISPLVERYNQKLNLKFLNSEIAQNMEDPFKILRRNQQNEMDLYCFENIELKKEIEKISDEITEIQGKLVVLWENKTIPIPALYPYLRSTDRKIREEAYKCLTATNLAVHQEIDEKFEKLLFLRNQIAKNAGFKNYTSYRFKEMERFDWDESHCIEFHRAVKKHILPIRKKLLEKRKKNLNLDSIKIYDMSVDINGREPLKIYEKGDSQSLITGAGKMIKAIDEELYQFFCDIKDNQLLDLEARENKSPGGYMVMYTVFEKASVFWNGAGLDSDLMVLLHELGHCFHYYLGKDITPYSLQKWTSEVAEAGSMSMELIGLEKMQEYLSIEACERIKEDRLTKVVGLFARCSMGDEFQHWIYANPGHSSQMRQEKWIELSRIYYDGIDLSKSEEEIDGKIEWQYAHILQRPFYLIDYAISELLALSIWDRYKKDPVDGMAHYKNGCRTGASKTVPEIYEIFGTKLNFGEEVIAPLAQRLMRELELDKN